MNAIVPARASAVPLGIGYYTVAEAARLLRLPPVNVRRWLGGYQYGSGAGLRVMPPLWSPRLTSPDGAIELAFRDLIELRFVKAFMDKGLGLATIRRCLAFARECLSTEHPFSTQRFRTDGRTIFLESVDNDDVATLLDLRRRQYELKQVIERSFKDLDIEAEDVVRWRPYRGRASIVIDPKRAFGQPIASSVGVPTVTLAQAVRAEGSIARAAQAYDVAEAVVRDAEAFEASLTSA